MKKGKLFYIIEVFLLNSNSFINGMLGQLEIETVLFSLLHYNFNKSVMDTINAQRKHELDSGASLASHWDPLQMLFRSYLSCVSSHPDTRL